MRIKLFTEYVILTLAPSFTFPSRMSSISFMLRPALPSSNPILSHIDTLMDLRSTVSREYPRYCRNQYELFSNITKLIDIPNNHSSVLVWIELKPMTSIWTDCQTKNHLALKHKKNLLAGSGPDPCIDTSLCRL